MNFISHASGACELLHRRAIIGEVDRLRREVMESPQQPPDGGEATITIGTYDAGRIVVLEGEHDLATLPGLESALQQAVGSGDGPAIIDFSACTYVDCATIGAITGAASGARVAIFVADTAAPIVRRLLEVLDASPTRVPRPHDVETNENAGHDDLWQRLVRVLLQTSTCDAGLLYILTDAASSPDGLAAAQPDEIEEPSATPPIALMVRAAAARRHAVESRHAHAASVVRFDGLRETCAATRTASGLVAAEYDARLREYRRARKDFDHALARLQALWSQPARAGRRWLQEVRSRAASHTAGGVRRRRLPAGLH
jgi:anti-anti-sigma regulatory factor